MIQNIVKYQVVIPGGKEKIVDRAVGFIHGWDDKRIHRLTCHFHTKRRVMPENTLSGNTVHLHYPIRIFGTILDVFRKEKPITVVYDETTTEGQIMTDHEMVGKHDNAVKEVDTADIIYRKYKN